MTENERKSKLAFTGTFYSGYVKMANRTAKALNEFYVLREMTTEEKALFGEIRRAIVKAMDVDIYKFESDIAELERT